MLGPAWVSMFRRIPLEMQDAIALVLTTQAEIVVQTVVRLERDFVVVRGRMAGSLDAARVVVVPYDQINYLAFNRKLTDAETHTMLGKPQPLEAVADEALPMVEEVAEQLVVPEMSAAAATLAALEPGLANETAVPVKPGQMSKSVLLARLRARLSKEGPGT